MNKLFVNLKFILSLGKNFIPFSSRNSLSWAIWFITLTFFKKSFTASRHRWNRNKGIIYSLLDDYIPYCIWFVINCDVWFRWMVAHLTTRTCLYHWTRIGSTYCYLWFNSLVFILVIPHIFKIRLRLVSYIVWNQVWIAEILSWFFSWLNSFTVLGLFLIFKIIRFPSNGICLQWVFFANICLIIVWIVSTIDIILSFHGRQFFLGKLIAGVKHLWFIFSQKLKFCDMVVIR